MEAQSYFLVDVTGFWKHHRTKSVSKISRLSRIFVNRAADTAKRGTRVTNNLQVGQIINGNNTMKLLVVKYSCYLSVNYVL